MLYINYISIRLEKNKLKEGIQWCHWSGLEECSRMSPSSLYHHQQDKLNAFDIYFFSIFIGVQLLYNAVFLLHNNMNQLYVYIYTHITSLLPLPLTFPIPPLQAVTKHVTDLPVLCSCFPTNNLFYIWQCIYGNATLSLRPSLPFPLPMFSSPFSTSASLFLSWPKVHQNHIFFFLIP